MLWSWRIAHGLSRSKKYRFPNTVNRVAGLYLVLDDVAQNAAGRQLNQKQTADLSSLIKGIRDVLEELAIVLEKYESLGKEPSTMSSKAAKTWHKLRWDQDAIKDFRSRIISNTTILDAFNSSLSSNASRRVAESLATLHESVGNLQLDNDQRERHALLDWLTPLNFPAQQSVFFSKRQTGTGRWLIDTAEFNTWMSTPGKNLVCRGMPGAGKTILASTVIDHLLKMLCGGKTSVVYIYCDYGKQHEQTPVNLIASILKQLLQHQYSIPENVRRSYRHHINSGMRPTAEEIYDLLRSTLSGFFQVYIVVDAVDELSVSGQVRQTLLSNLNALQETHTVNLMMTSRFIPRIAQELRDPLYLEIRANDEDVRRYVQGHLNDLAKCVLKNNNLQEIIVESIVNAVDGMFLLAQLHMDSLADKTSPKTIKKSLEDLPKGSDALDVAYEQAMRRIEDQKPGFSDLAKRTLSWITYTDELLTVAAVRHALAIEVGESELDEENLDEIEDVSFVCCGLVIIDPETDAVRLVHYTMQEYLRNSGSQHFPNAREDIAVSCLTYLLFDEFGEGWAGDNSRGIGVRSTTWVPLEARLQKYPFLRYAIQCWARHAKDYTGTFEDRVGKLLLKFLADECKVSSAGQIVLRKPTLYSFVNRPFGYGLPSRLDFESGVLSTTPMSGMHLVTYLNLGDLMSKMLETGLFAPDVKDQAGRTPIIWAAIEGHEAAMQVLLHRQDVDVNTIDNNEKVGWSPRTALTYAAFNGHARTVELLLEREDIDINMRGSKGNGMTPLIWTAARGHEAALNVLLKHKDIIADNPNSQGDTALSMAAEIGQIGIVQSLLERGDVDANHRNVDGATPLAIAVSRGYIPIVQLLLACKDVDVDSKDVDGRTVLGRAEEEVERKPKSPRRREVLEMVRSAIQTRSGTIEERSSFRR